MVHKLLPKKSRKKIQIQKKSYYEIEENQKPNLKKILLWKKGKLQAIFIYLSTTSKSMKHITKFIVSMGENRIRRRRAS
jgi:hypothetical protein